MNYNLTLSPTSSSSSLTLCYYLSHFFSIISTPFTLNTPYNTSTTATSFHLIVNPSSTPNIPHRILYYSATSFLLSVNLSSTLNIFYTTGTTRWVKALENGIQSYQASHQNNGPSEVWKLGNAEGEDMRILGRGQVDGTTISVRQMLMFDGYIVQLLQVFRER